MPYLHPQHVTHHMTHTTCLYAVHRYKFIALYLCNAYVGYLFHFGVIICGSFVLMCMKSSVMMFTFIATDGIL